MLVEFGERGFIMIISLRSSDQTFNIWQQKNKSSKATGRDSRKPFPLDMEQKE